MIFAAFASVIAEDNLATSFLFIFTLSLHCAPFYGYDNFKIILSSLKALLADEIVMGS